MNADAVKATVTFNVRKQRALEPISHTILMAIAVKN